VATPDKVDVAIVGAGAAASVFAAILAEAGKSVLVLESGPARKPADLYSSQIWARRLKWSTPIIEDKGKHSLWFNLNAGRGYGGAAIHHYGIWPRYHEDDFKLRTLYGKGLDWPIDYDDLRPYYDRVQADVGIAGDARREVWRPPGAPYPLPPVPTFGQAHILQRGFDAVGMRVAPLPLSILTQPYKGRPACIWDGWCDAGCPIGALGNPFVEYIPRAQKAGARLQADSHVLRILTDASGRRAIGVEYADPSGARRVQPAAAVVLAAFTGENVRLLLNSGTSAHPDGLANSSGTVGRYVMTHPAMYVFGMFEEETQPYMGATGGQLLSQDRFPKTANGKAFGSWQWEIGQALKPNDLLGIGMGRPELNGKALTEFLRRASHHVAVMGSVCEELPRPENRIELSDRTDAHGLRLAQAVYTASPDAVGLFNLSVGEGRRILDAAGAKEIWSGPMGGQHTMGGTIMGADPRASVTDRWCRTHDVPNLAIGGPSVFTTASCVNSTYTTNALAMLGAEAMVRDWDEIAA
jgi:choline dehydrogenase-like flavoprotein